MRDVVNLLQLENIKPCVSVIQRQSSLMRIITDRIMTSIRGRGMLLWSTIGFGYFLFWVICRAVTAHKNRM